MFDKMKQLMEMQKKMQEMKRELDNTNFEIASSDGLVKITMNGAQEVKDIIIQAGIQGLEKATLEKALKDAYNRAIKRSHELAAQKMKDITGFNIPGWL
ncbi:MAG: nucleoid-associated protein, YbaB/EbfC family [Candidatus Omnitrophica bacterium CG08_land_8_20_14_0_20_41_16]|uniref:Nucleoid-associated protein COX41_03405 n=1 Tax=Candidatus Sherwoodlollariibacterium unditelluris TaxID=1974757 RepID=A0A2G9YJB8_9BACT|nr:MAG: nucleoid-associated protein, YbaB/EbfC family [Candidatus Omnitrophica bacterium CG23_combo_of_CG06-09_8_20_14_all_41_10]PIS34438.1 MAG: nucleoid-associated protein, YbaB/EbfC family [Candidatus Omnitrophica bacterium CG08_land_8_20_14_0_20_41_16]